MLVLLLVLAIPDTSETFLLPVAHAESLAITVYGSGERTVIFLPGLFGSSFSYRNVMESLGDAGYRSLGIEPLGLGSSSRPDDANYSLTAQADRIVAAMDSLSVSSAIFVAHSLGASIAMRVGYRHPTRVRGIVSLEGGAGESATTPGFRRWIRFAPVIRMLDGRRIMQYMILRSMKKVSFDESWVSEQTVRSYTVGPARDLRATLDAYRGMARSEEPELLRDHLTELRCPVRLLVGQTEHGSGPPGDEVDLLVARLPLFTIDTVSASGYFIQEERPDVVVTAVTDVENQGSCAG
jgi:pimeloyl-ACP methyl ester carboxylesterase